MEKVKINEMTLTDIMNAVQDTKYRIKDLQHQREELNRLAVIKIIDAGMTHCLTINWPRFHKINEINGIR